MQSSMSISFPEEKMFSVLHILFYGLIILIHLLQTSAYANNQNTLSCNSSCGNIQNISYPFRLIDDPEDCGDYEFVCENNTTFLYYDYYYYHTHYRVLAINYTDQIIRLAYTDINENDTCSFLHSYPVDPSFSFFFDLATYITLLSCQYPINNPNFSGKACDCSTKRDDASNDSLSSKTSIHTYMAWNLTASDVQDMCRIDGVVLLSSHFLPYDNLSVSELHGFLLYGFEIAWLDPPDLPPDEKLAWYTGFGRSFIRFCLLNLTYIIGPIVARFIFGVSLVLWLIIYKYRTRHLSMYDAIEGFLQHKNNLATIRYSYWDIKKMTRGFREKLGQGGYGSVYKGKLRSGSDVAVKVLTKPKENGKDFMNEISTIGRIHHVNVVKLIGYCAERSKCALVYDFMPKGSLEKYIQSEETSNSLSWNKKYDIAVGVARGIQYLHRGCDIQILHFDIKPHNILLDDNFTPKISDFGLAKSYSTDHNTVTLTAARGTIGYVAPELINRSIGSVSYKADVYSFGMLLMGMVGLNRDLVANTDDSSQYFPQWIYSHLDKWKDVELGNGDEITPHGDDDEKITRKMTIVALWCIQMSPGDRPSMSRVLEMLESEVKLLQIPPQPSYPAPEQFVQSEGTYTSDSITLLCDDNNSSDHQYT